MDMMPSHRIKRIFFSFVSLFLLVTPVLFAAEIPTYRGTYSGHLVWQGEVTMTGDVLIPAGASLEIRAGTRINVIPAEGTKIDPEYLSPLTELLIRGRLVILGTPRSPVRFVVDENQNKDISWAGITLDGAEKSIIQNVEITAADIGIRCVESSPDLLNNRISGCRYGIIAQKSSHPKIVGNEINGGEGGIFCWLRSNPLIRDNRISGHDEEALFIDADSQPKLGFNIIRDNAIGLAIYSRDLHHDALQLDGNVEDLRWLGLQGLERRR